MITAVFAIGLFNLAVGFALAILLEGPPVVARAVRRQPRNNVSGAGRADTAHPPNEAPAQEPNQEPATDTVAGAAEANSADASDDENDASSTLPVEPFHQWLPYSLLNLLANRGITPRSFAESVLWVVRSSLPGSRQEVVDACRDYELNGSTAAARQLITSIKNWHSQASEWAQLLRENRESVQYEEVRKELQSILAEHANKMRSLTEAVAQADPQGDLLIDRKALLRLVDELIRTSDTVGEHVDDALANLLLLEKRLADSTEQLQFDPTSQVLNRIGLAVLVDDWLSHDPERVRLVCGVMIDIDKVAQLNETFGPTAGDAVLRAAGALLKDSIRKQRGYDRVARITGQKFFLYYGDTGIRNAMNGAERVRQTLEATTFKVGESTVALTTCCAVAEWQKDESLDHWVERLQDLIKEAKKSGRNKTCVGDEGGSRIVATKKYQIPPREIVVDLTAPAEPDGSS